MLIDKAKVMKTNDFKIWASVIFKTTSKPQQPQNPHSGFCFKLHC